MGENPARYIVYPGGNAYYVDTAVEEHILSAGSRRDGDELDDIFWNFIKPEIRRVIEPFRNRSKKERVTGSLKDMTEKVGGIHLFDKRRIHYLRYGQIDKGFIGRISPKLAPGTLR